MKLDLKLGIELGMDRDFEISRNDAFWLEGFALRQGSILSLQDKRGKWFRVRLTSLSETDLRFRVFEEMRDSVESELELILLQAIPSRERMELIIEKTVELGVDLIQPVFSLRSYGFEDFPQKKWHRWQERARKASEQSRRGIVPKVLEPVPLLEATDFVRKMELKLVFDEAEVSNTLKGFLGFQSRVRSCVLAVGPEGGWERSEIDMLKELGFVPVFFGRRIMRVETAAIVGVGIIEYVLGMRE